MPHKYTRQRQGRDFSIHAALMNALAANRMVREKVQVDEEAKKSLAQRLEHYREKAERNAAPVDGYEPLEKERNLA